MADELTINGSAQLVNGNHKEQWSVAAYRVDQAAIGAHSTLVTVGFGSEEDMPVGDVTVMGWLFLENLDSTNFVTWGPKSGGVMIDMGRIEAGETVQMRMEPGVILRWQADTADVQVKMMLLED